MTTDTTEGTGLAENLLEIDGLYVRELDNTSTGANTTSGNAILTGIVTGSTPGIGGAFMEADLYSHGCMLTKTDGLTGTGGIYQNEGTLASPSWAVWGSV